MPCQVSSQFVATKSQKLAHGLGLEAVAGGGAVVGTLVAAHASARHEMPAAARITPAQTRSLVMRAPCLSRDDSDLAKVGPQAAVGHSPPPNAAIEESSDPCSGRATEQPGR